MVIIEAKFTFFQVQTKCPFTHPSKLAKAAFSKPPEAFNAIDVDPPAHELIVPMHHLEMLAIADINQAIIAAPAVGVNDTIEVAAQPRIIACRVAFRQSCTISV